MGSARGGLGETASLFLYRESEEATFLSLMLESNGIFGRLRLLLQSSADRGFRRGEKQPPSQLHLRLLRKHLSHHRWSNFACSFVSLVSPLKRETLFLDLTWQLKPVPIVINLIWSADFRILVPIQSGFFLEGFNLSERYPSNYQLREKKGDKQRLKWVFYNKKEFILVSKQHQIEYLFDQVLTLK